MTTVDLPATTPRADAPADLPEPTAPAPERRRAGQFILDVLASMGREPTIWGPWLMMTPYPPRHLTRR
jgi:hypothetical protein